MSIISASVDGGDFLAVCQHYPQGRPLSYLCRQCTPLWATSVSSGTLILRGAFNAEDESAKLQYENDKRPLALFRGRYLVERRSYETYQCSNCGELIAPWATYYTDGRSKYHSGCKPQEGPVIKRELPIVNLNNRRGIKLE